MNKEEAIKIVKSHYPANKQMLNEALEFLIPELKVSEDELTWLKNYISEEIYYLSMDIRDNEDMDIRDDEDIIKLQKLQKSLAWLEKQDEKKVLNLVEILKHYPEETELYSPLYGKLWLAEVDEENEIITCYKYPLNEGCTRAILEQENTISFYSDGTTGLPDCTISKDCMLFLYNKNQSEQKPVEWSEEDERNIKELLYLVEANYLSSEEPHDRLMQFLKLLKDRIQLNQSNKPQGKTALEANKEENVDNANKVEPKFKVGDFIVYNDDDCTCQIKSIRGNDYCIWPLDSDVEGWLEITDIDNKCHLWTIEDTKDGDVLIASDGSIFIFAGVLGDACKYYVALTLYNGVSINKEVEFGYWEMANHVHPATKEQCDLLFEKIKERGVEWDADKKELKLN